LSNTAITIYTDGSCHTQHRIGGWASLLFIGEEKIVLSGTDVDTTHNRMELTAVIKAVEYAQERYTKAILHIISDSQYVIGLKGRKEKLSGAGFITKKGNEIQNADLVQRLLLLVEQVQVTFTKIKAHQRQGAIVNHNLEVDKLSRKIVRDAVAATGY
jgi:ribonuclease HI